MLNELLTCDDAAAYRASLEAEALAWWDGDFYGVRMTDGAAFAAIEMAIAERAAAVCSDLSGYSSYVSADAPVSDTAFVPVSARLTAMRNKIIVLATQFANLDPGTEAAYNGYAGGSVPRWTAADIGGSAHPMADIPGIGEADQSAAQQAKLSAFLLDCKYWLLKLRCVDVSNLAFWTRRHRASGSHWAVDGDDPWEDINGVLQPGGSITPCINEALAQAASSEDGNWGVGNNSSFSMTRYEVSACRPGIYGYGERLREIRESANTTVYSGLNVRNPSVLQGAVRVVFAPVARPALVVESASISVGVLPDYYYCYYQEFNGSTLTAQGLFNGEYYVTQSKVVDSGDNATVTDYLRRPDGSLYSQTTSSGGDGWSGWVFSAEDARLLGLSDLTPRSGVVVAGGATAAGVVPALAALPTFDDSPPDGVSLPSLALNTLNDYNLELNHTARAIVLIDYGDYYTFGENA